MAVSPSPTPSLFPLRSCLLSLLLSALFFFFFFFFFSSPHPHSHASPRRSLLHLLLQPSCTDVVTLPDHQRCAFALARCHVDGGSFLNYTALHYCLLSQHTSLSLPLLLTLLSFHFLFLVRAASLHFSPVVSRLASRLRLSPSMAAVTLLALGNGAPDVFASLAALRSGHPRTGLGAILSAGAFVSALVVGLVAVHAAPFPVHPAPFVRDAFLYLLAASALFYVYLTGEIHLWQAAGFVAFYLFFVGFVFRMDSAAKEELGKKSPPAVVLENLEAGDTRKEDRENDHLLDYDEDDDNEEEEIKTTGWRLVWANIKEIWEFPVLTILKLTIPSISPARWSRFYYSSNIALCPLVLIYAFRSYIPLDHRIVFLIPKIHLPIWFITLFCSLSLSITHYILEKDPPEAETIPVILIAFLMSVFWISTMAGELLNCLAAVGTIMDLPPALLGLTVLAWGNSVGDLVANVAVAKAGQPAMAMAGCFAGPMFNMLIGLGSALVIETANVYPKAYQLQLHISIVVAFVFLLVSLMGSLLVVTWCRFHVPRFWGFCLVGLYVLFTATSLVISAYA